MKVDKNLLKKSIKKIAFEWFREIAPAAIGIGSFILILFVSPWFLLLFFGELFIANIIDDYKDSKKRMKIINEEFNYDENQNS